MSLPTSSQIQATLSGLPNNSRMNNFEVDLDPSGNIRKEVWQNALNHFVKNPLIGTGYSSIGIGADNQYLRMLGEVGILGLISFLAIICFTVWSSFKYYISLEGGYIKGFFAAELAFILGLCSMAFLIDIFDSSKVAYLLWFLVGLGYKTIYNSRVESS